jgi:hypothetical protein
MSKLQCTAERRADLETKLLAAPGRSKSREKGPNRRPLTKIEFLSSPIVEGIFSLYAYTLMVDVFSSQHFDAERILAEQSEQSGRYCFFILPDFVHAMDDLGILIGTGTFDSEKHCSAS